MLKALLIDDEVNNLENLKFILEQDFEGIVVTGKVTTANEAREWLQLNTVDVVFLDINMPSENGFQFLSSLSKRNFKVIFVTAYHEYAIQAIRASALDYIVKPINIDDLRVAIDKLKKTVDNPLINQQQQQLIEHLLSSVNRKTVPQKIALPQMGGISFIEVNEIVSLQADSNYTIIHMTNMQKMVITKTLKEFELLLDESQFFRIHKSYIVNLTHIKEYSSSDGGLVKMVDGNQWSISRRQIDQFLEKMKLASLMFGNK
jgi:two-component system, LytTR family, response regulator